MSFDSDINQVRRKAEQQGWRYDVTERGHHRFYSPNKKDIVVTSGTPGDVRGYQNFLANMRRAGYMDDPGAIGLALLAAKGGSNMNAEVREAVAAIDGAKATMTVAGLIRELLRTNPETVYDVEGVHLHARARIPEAQRNNVNMCLAAMVDRGEAVRVGHGEYKATVVLTHGHRQEHKEDPKPQPAPAPAPAPLPTTNTNPISAIGAAIGTMSGDPAVDADLKIMDEALVALSRIGEVVSRNRERLLALAQFKKLMGG